jgi:hypothetical protein
MRMRYTDICGLPWSTIFVNILINGAIFEKEIYWTQNCVLIFSKTIVWNISYSKK